MGAPEGGAGPIGFPVTRVSVVAALASADGDEQRRALDAVVRAYWKPVYRYLRVARGLAHEDAEDLTQEFFAHALRRDTLAQYDPGRARFRTFLRVCLDHFASNAAKAARRLKRGGGLVSVPLDFAEAERTLEVAGVPVSDPEAYFRREWVRSLFESALAGLEAELTARGKAAQYRAFVAYDIEAGAGGVAPSYETVGAQLGLSVTQVTNALSSTRKAFRRHVLDRLRAICGSDEEYEREARDMLGFAE